MRLMLAAIFVSLALAGCAAPPPAPEPEIRVVESLVQVPVPCLDRMPTRPQLLTEAEILAYPNYDAAFVLFAEWDKQRAYIDTLESILPPCLAP